MEKTLRRLQNNLVVAGTGLVVFSAWNVVRTLLLVFSYRKELMAYIEMESEEGEAEVSPVLVLVLLVAIVVAVILP